MKAKSMEWWRWKMRSIRQPLVAVPVMLGVLLLAACQTASEGTTQAAGYDQPKTFWQKIIRPAHQTVALPAGTEITVRLVDSVGSARNRSGDSFLATLDEPIVVSDRVVVPRGANVTGRVVSAQPSGHLQTPAELALTLTALEFGGRTYELQTSSYSRRALSHAKRDAGWIGGMAAGGALIGALAGGGKGAAIGAGAGAAGGTATAYATGKKDILLPSETRLSFALRQPVKVVKAG